MSMINYKYSFTILLAGFFLISCNGKKTENTRENNAENQITISEGQFKENGMELGKPVVKPFTEEVSCKGYITAPVNARAKVTSLISGKITSLQIRPGQFVSKGNVICAITSTEFIDIQKDYAENSAKFVKIKADYDRLKSLREENIGAEKDFISIKSDYNAASASLNAARAKLNSIGLNPANIENGKIYNVYTVTAPISGYVTSISAVLGQYADMTTEIAEIVNVNQTQLTLSVFENDVYRLKPGQIVRFNVAGSTENLLAKLISIGKSINTESKTIDCIANMETSLNKPLINEGYVQANIITAQTELQALPNSAFVKSEGAFFVYILKEKKSGNYIFEKKEVHITKSNDEYSAVSESLPEQETLIKGGSTL
ncbi:putative Membrane-fusion protein [uncultured Paludibacter sp.]|uniref:Putative Membrane-fusion protein n=1 Tax=uncultured Paludibacter sp. TaxID=497635 RepID=A0A653AK70_9BACT|nr:putative Membrane-fusion protein [uncultured Paludibacter sp.]